MPNVIPEKLQSYISADFITKLLLAQEYDIILVVYNRFSKMAHFIATIEKISAKELAKLFRDHIQKLYRFSESIISDKRVQFATGIIKELNKLFGIWTKLPIAYHPQIDRQTEKVNQELKQYLRVFIDHRQEQQLDQLVTVEFVYNNKIYLAIKVLPFKANYSQDLRMEFEGKKKEKYEVVGKFVERIWKIQKKAKAALKKAQDEIKKFTDRKQSKGEKYKVGDLVLLSTKDLK